MAVSASPTDGVAASASPTARHGGKRQPYGTGGPRETRAMKTHYSIHIAWSDDDQAYIARVPAIPGCMSHGDSYAKAAANVQEAIKDALDAKEQLGFPVPEPDLAGEEILRFAPLLNVAKLARAAGLNYNTLASKLRRGSSFTPEGARAIRAALERV